MGHSPSSQWKDGERFHDPFHVLLLPVWELFGWKTGQQQTPTSKCGQRGSLDAIDPRTHTGAVSLEITSDRVEFSYFERVPTVSLVSVVEWGRISAFDQIYLIDLAFSPDLGWPFPCLRAGTYLPLARSTWRCERKTTSDRLGGRNT